MTIARLIFGILVGYAIFALTAVLAFALTGRDPHAAGDPAIMVSTIGAGTIAAAAGGYIGAAIAKGHERMAGFVIGGIIAGAALISLLVQPGDGATWSQLAALVGMSPAAIVGALARARRSH